MDAEAKKTEEPRGRSGNSVPLIGIVYFAPTFSTRLLFLGFPWAITAPLFMLMLAIMLRRRQSASTIAA